MRGVSWAEVYKELGYHRLDKYERTYQRNGVCAGSLKAT